MVRYLLALIVLIAMTIPSLAGPWPREKGETFLSFSSTVLSPRSNLGSNLGSYYAAYLERGLSKELTFGLDAGIDESNRYTAILFLRKPILQQQKDHRFALSIGLGAKGDQDTNGLLISGGASWGKGFETKWGPGWATLDLHAHYVFTDQDVVAKADLTVGLKPRKKLKLMMQLQTGAYPNSDPYIRLAPSIAWAMRPGRHLEIGGHIGLSGDDKVGVKVGTWMQF